MTSSIPVQNIYYLLCYAWDRLDEGELTTVQEEDVETLQDLLASVLINGTCRLIKRGFHRDYREKASEMSSLRGRIAFTPSVRELTWAKGGMICEFSELSYNTIPNRILKVTLRNLLFTDRIDESRKEEIRGLMRDLHEVNPIKVSRKLFHRIQYHQNLGFYRFLMNVCELIHESLIPREGDGPLIFRDFVRDEKKMAQLFEEFVFNFFRRHSGSQVQRRSFQWQGVTGDASAIARLPTLNTDVELRDGNQLTIIDCKYYREAFSTNWGVERYKTQNLYQLYAYVMNRKLKDPELQISGMLLYPEVSGSFHDRLILQGHPITIASINLKQPWAQIHEDLLAII